jgi:hypothetical protein
LTGFQNAGFSMTHISDNMTNVVKISREMGVNAQVVSSSVVSNLEKLNKFGFPNGVEGLAKMAAKAASLRMDMASTFKIANDIFDRGPEAAIEISASLQRLGAASGSLLDPIKLMDLAQNNVPELQNQLVELSKQYSVFNEETGQFEIMPGARRQINEVEKALGMSSGELSKMSLEAAKLDKKLSEPDISVGTLGVRPDLATVGSTTYESNVVLLFTDAVQTPSVNFNNWGDAYSEVINGTKVFSPTAQEKPTYNYKNDVCVGAAYLDKGFIVITHPLIVDSYFKNVFNGYIYTSGVLTGMTKNYDVTKNSSGSSVVADSRGTVRTTDSNDTYELIVTKDGTDILWDSTQFIYTGTTDYKLSYNSYNTEKSLNIVCLASSDEFFKSTNDTAKDMMSVDQMEDYASFKSTNGDLYPVIITQLGIHDQDGNLLAICKPTQPIKKYWYDVVSFNIKIRL